MVFTPHYFVVQKYQNLGESAMRNALKPSILRSTVRALGASSSLYRTAFASMAFVAVTAGEAIALPVDGVVQSGAATINQPSSTQLVVNQATDRVVIDWRNFDIMQGESTQFIQPNSGSIALNRVRDGNPTQILGSLSANGKLILVNPNGVFFGAGATVDVAGMVVRRVSRRSRVATIQVSSVISERALVPPVGVQRVNA